ncbi:MAG: hypothetical protein K2W95_10525 [Candidatus Obscuribacterales bacterium]|nr:hypothetical protein [Candidatus Obscuribacterales bacterium]
MTVSNNLNLGPKFLELDALVKEGTTEWRNKEAIKAEQKFLRAAEVRGQLYTNNEIDNLNLDLQKVDKILSGTLNNFAVINLENQRNERALELASRGLELLQKAESFDQEYFDTLDLLKEIHEKINEVESASMPKPTIKPVTTKKTTGSIAIPLQTETAPEPATAPAKKKTSPRKKS